MSLNRILFPLFFVIFSACSELNSHIELQELSNSSSVFVPEYYSDHIKQKEEQINDAISLAKDNYASLVFFTDAHWGANHRKSPALINHIIHNTPIDDVVFGGDVITTAFDNPNEAYALGKSFRMAYDTLTCNLYYLYGNHDNNSDVHPNEEDIHLTDEQVYSYLQLGMGDCIYGNYFNFYYDRPASRTRFICLDTGRFYYSKFRISSYDTIQFLINALNETPSGWMIVVLSHFWYDLDQGKPRKVYLSSFMRSFIAVLDNYNARAEGEFIYQGKSVAYDFSNALSSIICCIGGHCHVDSINYSDGGIPIFITTTDSKQTMNGEDSTEGTINEQAISVFLFDYQNNIIKLFRIGRGNDIAVNLKNTCNYM